MHNRIQEIREAHEKEEKILSEHPEWRKSAIKAHEYIGYLLSEYDRLQEENKAMREALEWIRDAGTDYQSINKAIGALSHLKG